VRLTSTGIEITHQGKPIASTLFGAGSARADIVFVIDTTGSMSDKIEGLLQTCQKFVDEIAQRKIDWQIAIVGFGDLTVEGDKIVATTFSRNVEVIKQALLEIPHNSGGSNEGESSLEALEKAMGLTGYREGAIKVFILMTDEPALQRGLTPRGVTQKLIEQAVLTFVISEAQDYFKIMASRTGGDWFEISSGTNFLSILDRLIKKVGQMVTAVQLDAGGDVKKYLQLKGGHA
jgi:Mg-chelatase subunit ChlD